MYVNFGGGAASSCRPVMTQHSCVTYSQPRHPFTKGSHARKRKVCEFTNGQETAETLMHVLARLAKQKFPEASPTDRKLLDLEAAQERQNSECLQTQQTLCVAFCPGDLQAAPFVLNSAYWDSRKAVQRPQTATFWPLRQRTNTESSFII